jgi:ParB family chromosome partitioning protein
VLGEVISKGLSVRDTEKLVSRYQDGSSTSKNTTDKHKPVSQKSAEINRIEQHLRSLLGVKVELQYDDKGTGQIRIPFKSDKELNYILDTLDELDEKK